MNNSELNKVRREVSKILQTNGIFEFILILPDEKEVLKTGDIYEGSNFDTLDDAIADLIGKTSNK